MLQTHGVNKIHFHKKKLNHINQPKGVEPKMRERELTKLARGVKAKMRKTNGGKIRFWLLVRLLF
jgi:hypothetical protein